MPAGTEVIVSLSCIVPEHDWRGQPNKIDSVELIGVTTDSAKMIESRQLGSDGSVQFNLCKVPPGGIVFRGRGRRVVTDGPDLMFYTNPIRVMTR